MTDYLPPMAPVSTNTLSWLEESDYALASYRAFLRHARKPSSHDQRLPRHGVWPTCGPNCAAYIAHSFPGTLGLSFVGLVVSHTIRTVKSPDLRRKKLIQEYTVPSIAHGDR